MTTADQRTAIIIESADEPGRHCLKLFRGIQQVAGIALTQGEMIDLWQKIGAYFNLAGMAPLGDRPHEHRYSGQVLRHSHDGGNEPHGYFQHPEDYPQEQPGPGESYNGQPFAIAANPADQVPVVEEKP